MTLTEKYYEEVINESLYSAKNHLKFKLNKLFRDINFTDKKVLDIGGGNGLFSFYAAVEGAAKVVCLEPMEDGSDLAMNDNFERLREKLNLENITLLKKTFQEYETGQSQFDVIIMHNSINHLDEQACITLTRDAKAEEKYRSIFKKLNKTLRTGGVMLICDSSSRNFYRNIGLANPFAANIEWNKHHTPEIWTKLLEEAGFVRTKLSWNSPKQLGRPGSLILGHKATAYFLISHFRLEVKKVAELPEEILLPKSDARQEEAEDII